MINLNKVSTPICKSGFEIIIHSDSLSKREREAVALSLLKQVKRLDKRTRVETIELQFAEMLHPNIYECLKTLVLDSTGSIEYFDSDRVGDIDRLTCDLYKFNDFDDVTMISRRDVECDDVATIVLTMKVNV
ncbi:hypothetical protein EVB94_217 [Rhizobium phage RHph_TM40]|uniref:Uncharacterized protein n=2 Tax=Cuauhnahuacvirus TaxID=3044696 RepID=A0A7S5R7Y7_9CAUD|nr:hypothetical protein PQC16_gp218 [Rhizobium phage RHph_TM30]YP_010671367.1 hypothetical protein PQC17_gp218 [Rhizobium phage RHph_Y65]QIG71688.1 hypothetical protein EVB94_217 [Rhizobium phage RHph_TM40]QIG72051.1 hypothetical protein EVB95_217 [Rhizobium phage RHph_TM2_3B]QIG72414.1 hypothetical protein EVB96_218 [Rhizobium phage RHph_TM3_3_6]QIG77804.1 hypothetical protein EVB64_217 [Rhizobium phage RHph_TM61]QIG71325.1 hypothetical protein EVB93_218 [Rhizobium phage RHph_TM30]